MFLVLTIVLSCKKHHDKPIEDFKFDTPAYQGKKDMKGASEKNRIAFYNAWDNYVNRYTVTAATYNLSGGYNYTVPGETYINPKDQPDFFNGAAQIPVRWEAFPGRILFYLKDKFQRVYKNDSINGQDRLYELVDIGPEAYQAKYKDSMVYIPKSPCNPNPKELKLLDPPGPRGWLDEYCEMGIKRNSDKKIEKLHFTCENPEYYWTLWKIDPNKVVEIYQTTLENDSIKIEDLYLKDAKNQYVVDRATGGYAYNPINKWNKGPKMTTTFGGAMHLTSPPNELSAEIVLAGGGAVLRKNDTEANAVANTLICCSKYGRAFRHSDPHIGQNVYQAVSEGLEVSLLNPVGLYLQEPEYSYFELPENAPEGAKIEDCFRFVRGVKKAKGYPNNMILHMIMEVPASWDSSITLNDFKVLGSNIQYGSQVMETIKVQLAAAGKPATAVSKAKELDCTTGNAIVGVSYFVDENILEASLHHKLNVKANVTCNIATVAQNSTVNNLAVTIDNVVDENLNPIEAVDFKPENFNLSFPDTEIEILSFEYIGKSKKVYRNLAAEGEFTFSVNISVPENTPIGQHGLLITNNGFGLTIPKMIEVVKEGTLTN